MGRIASVVTALPKRSADALEPPEVDPNAEASGSAVTTSLQRLTGETDMASKISKHLALARKNYIETFETSVCGIPCIVGVMYYQYTKPNSFACNPSDYYGGTECEWELLDTRYRVASWLHAKIEKLKMEGKVHDMVCEYMATPTGCAYDYSEYSDYCGDYYI
ncbi:MAG TPA: hypothetical protein DCF63_11890 [Planctomycetaceae bacterium]|nr:hypothetical protein [Planctomycetaceae bacterium]